MLMEPITSNLLRACMQLLHVFGHVENYFGMKQFEALEEKISGALRE